MPYPRNVNELCDRLRTYLNDVHEWQKRKADQLDALSKKGHEGGDPPPPPPDLGP